MRYRRSEECHRKSYDTRYLRARPSKLSGVRAAHLSLGKCFAESPDSPRKRQIHKPLWANECGEIPQCRHRPKEAPTAFHLPLQGYWRIESNSAESRRAHNSNNQTEEGSMQFRQSRPSCPTAAADSSQKTPDGSNRAIAVSSLMLVAQRCC